MALGLQLPTAVGEAGTGMVHGCGRASEQGRGLCRNRHIAHPNLPTPFPAANSQWSLRPHQDQLHSLPQLCSQAPAGPYPSPSPAVLSGIKLRCLEGWVGFVPEDTDS